MQLRTDVKHSALSMFRLDVTEDSIPQRRALLEKLTIPQLVKKILRV
jgi:hypothetical protein